MSLVFIKATSQSAGDLHLLDATNWNVSKSLIKVIRIATSSTDWDLYILQNDNGYSTDDANIPKLQIMEAGNGNADIYIDLPYEDEDASDEVHLYYLDNSGSNTADIYIIGVSLEDAANIITEIDANETKIDNLNNLSAQNVRDAMKLAPSGNSPAAGSVDKHLDDIIEDTAEIGTAGAGLTAVPWNSNWDIEVQSECADALTAYAPPTKAEMDTAHALLATPAQVNAQVLDVLNTDTFAEPGQEAPGAKVSLVTKIGYLYKYFRNKITQTSTTLNIYNDAGDTVDQKSTISDDGTTFTKGEIGTGP